MGAAVLLLTICELDQCCWAQAELTHSAPDVQQLLTKLAGVKPDPCGPPYEVIANPADIEDHVFRQAEEIVIKALNENSADRKESLQRAGQALKRLEQLSADINAPWPEENRFHFQMLDLSPALVVKMAIGTHDRFYVLGIPAESHGDQERLWQEVGRDEEIIGDRVPQSHLEIYPFIEALQETQDFSPGFTTAAVQAASESFTTPASGIRGEAAGLNKSSSKVAPSASTTRSRDFPKLANSKLTGR